MECELKKDNRTCILVAGMHRSGTSATARVVNLLGADISGNLLIPSQDNVSGYWESVDIYAFHESLLGEMGLSWDSTLALPTYWDMNTSNSKASRWIKTYVQSEFPNSDCFVVKDPRLARLLPLWKVTLNQLNVEAISVIPYRHPLEVVASLNKREINNPLHSGLQFTKQYGSLLWLRHILEAEKYSRKTRRSFFSYYSLLMDWRQVSNKMEKDLGIFWNPKDERYEKKIDSFVRSDLYLSKDILIDEVEQLPWVYETFEALNRLELDPYDLTAMQTLDGINEELARADGIFTEIIKESEAKAKDLKNKEEKNQRLIADLQGKLAQIEHERNEMMQDSFQELRLERDKLVSQVQDLSAQVTSLTQENENSKVSDALTKDKSQIKHE